MSESRRTDFEEGGRAKRQKTNGANLDPRANPYLAHHYEDEANGNGTSNGDGGVRLAAGKSEGGVRLGRSSQPSPLQKFERHGTTAAQASKAEDGPASPFTGEQFSKRYFDILKTRRNLPVHAQR